MQKKKYDMKVYLLAICLCAKNALFNSASERGSSTLKGEWFLARFFANCWIGEDVPRHSYSFFKVFYIGVKTWRWEQGGIWINGQKQ